MHESNYIIFVFYINIIYTYMLVQIKPLKPFRTLNLNSKKLSLPEAFILFSSKIDFVRATPSLVVTAELKLLVSKISMSSES